MGHRNLRFAAVMGLHTFISAGTYLLGKPAADAIPTLALGLLRFLIAGAGFLILARLRHLELWSVARSEWRTYLWAGFLGVTLNQLAFLGGLAFTLPSHAALLYALTPTVVLLLAWARGQERPGPRKLGGLALAFSGVLVLFSGKAGGALPPRWILGDLLVLAAVVAWAGYTVMSRPLVQRHGAQRATTLSILFGLAIFAPLGALGLPGLKMAAVPPVAWVGLVYLGLMTSVVSYLLWFHALSIKEPSRVAIATNGQPVATAILAWIVYGQAITPAFAVGAALVLGGVLLTQL
ncbi:MAG TPA: DMT family transporter [Holophagaceae bacterium]|nr:DMT family transporter [Holophagaceae bacterium]